MGHPALHDPALFLLPFFHTHTDSLLRVTVTHYAERAGGFGLLPTPERRPFLVRALVLVRWPRTGNPFRWRRPR